MHRISAVTCGLLAVLSAVRGAAAQPAPAAQPEAVTPAPAAAPTTFALELKTTDCATSESQLADAILTRVPSAVRVDSGEADVKLAAEISASGVSSLRVALPQGASQRDFHGVSCAEATAIIAFVASLVLDARPEERLSATELAGLPEAPRQEPKPEEKPKQEPPATLAAPRRDPGVPASSDVKPRFGLSAAVALESAVAPTPPLGALVGLNLRWERPGWFSPELRAELLVTSTGSVAAKSGELNLSLMAGRLSACPLRYHALRALQASLCATLDGGRLHAQGDSALNGFPNPMPWLAGGAALRGEVPLSRELALELLLGAKLLAFHDNFTLEPDQTLVYAVPVFSGGLALGLSFRP